MAKPTVGRTALGAATCRLIEQYQPTSTRLFTDPLVKDLVGGPIRWMMGFSALRQVTVQQTNAVLAGLYGAQVCRTRAIDDAVQKAFAEGIDQLVILGAGLDTRPYRLPSAEHVRSYEVDLPAVQAGKKEQLVRALGQLPEGVTFLPIDFDTQSLESVMTGTDFDRSRPAVFVWEGVTQYLTEAAVRQTLAFVGSAASGSVLVFTYVLKRIIERRPDFPGADKIMDTVSKSAPWLFGLEPGEVADFLAPFHLELIEDVGSADYQERYLKPLGRELDVSAAERVVQARVAP